jgi:phenylacetate-coenzyme A ligase PaaK-like adenylate-forming protein
MNLPLPEEIFTVIGTHSFERRAIEIFRFQARQCPVYSQYISLLGVDAAAVDNILNIPFMPVTFFRDHLVITGGSEPEKVFFSSGTTGMRQSRHAVKSLAIYDESLERTFRSFYGDPKQYAFICLLPSYLERQGSSLAYMISRLMQLSGNNCGGFFLYDYDALLKATYKARSEGKQVLLFGVTFALLDMAEKKPCDLSDVVIMETGGMKGRGSEMIREEVHTIIKGAFGVRSVHSEYGMTELLSQAYSDGEGLFSTPPWMKVLIRDSHDPSSHTMEAGTAGGISIIDLANIYSCSFIATSDLGRMYAGERFEVLGRFDDADIRGCNLLVS